MESTARVNRALYRLIYEGTDIETRECRVCGQTFVPDTIGQQVCSDECEAKL